MALEIGLVRIAVITGGWTCPYVLCESFEGSESGYDNTGWTEVESAGNTINPDDTTYKYNGSHGCSVNKSSGTAVEIRTYKSVSSSSTYGFYAKFLFHSGLTTNYETARIVLLAGGADTAGEFWVQRSGSTYQLEYRTAGTRIGNQVEISVDTWYTIKCHGTASGTVYWYVGTADTGGTEQSGTASSYSVTVVYLGDPGLTTDNFVFALDSISFNNSDAYPTNQFS